MRHGALSLLAIVALAVAGCSTGDDKAGAGPDDPVAALVTVPDVGRLDGAAAVKAVSARGFKTSLEEVNGVSAGSEFKAAGCTVSSQDPPGNAKAKRGGTVTLTLDCDERDWEAETGSAWDAFDQAYRRGFDVGCKRLFALTATGLLNNAGTDLALEDCQKLKPADAGDASTVPPQLPQDPKAAGRRYGIADGCQALFDDQGVDELDAGDGAAVVAAADCEKAKRAPPKPPADAGGTQAPPSDDSGGSGGLEAPQGGDTTSIEP